MKIYNQSWRSFVEILGVLAIIGVLSIGGIAAYNTAMNKYRANEMLDRILQYAHQASAQVLSGGALSTSLDNNVVDGFAGCDDCNFSISKPKRWESPDQFIVRVFGPIPKTLCKQAFTFLGEDTPIHQVRLLDGSYTSAGCDNLDGTSMTSMYFIFNDDLHNSDGSNNECSVGSTTCGEDWNVYRHCVELSSGKTRWQDAGFCDYGCDSNTGACRSSSCNTNGEEICFAGVSNMIVCENGEWSSTLCTLGCVNGVCQDNCSTPGDKACIEDVPGFWTVVNCTNNHKWDLAESGSSSTVCSKSEVASCEACIAKFYP